MADVEFFFDPVCPWAWLTSRWVREVAEQRDLSVEWRFIALRILNQDKNYETDFAPRYVASHGTGLKMLRVLEAVRREEGESPIGDWYTQFAGDIHVTGRRDEIFDAWESGFPEYLRSVGMDEKYISSANDPSLDEALETSTKLGLSRVGDGVGTPIVTFNAVESTSFFGPVISRVPRGDEALELWDAVWKLSTFAGFAELKRAIRDKPQLAGSL